MDVFWWDMWRNAVELWRESEIKCRIFKKIFNTNFIYNCNFFLINFCMFDGILSIPGRCTLMLLIIYRLRDYWRQVCLNSKLNNFFNKFQTISVRSLLMIESSVKLVLALNRCIIFVCTSIARVLFSSSDFGADYRVWLWIVPSTVWGLWYFVMGTPLIFTSIYHIETWNPHRGYYDDMFKYLS